MRTSLILASLLLIAACQSPGGGSAQSSATVPGSNTIRQGQTLALPDGSQLTYVRVVADSRCRPDVQCIRAGDADIEFRWNPAAGNALIAVLNSDPRNQQQAPNQTQFGEWQVALASLDWKEPPVAEVSISKVQ